MNYKDIGKRIRQYRKLKNLSQEQLAEKIEISVPHMSHIETGSTKLSLQVLVDISIALDVNTDDLIFGEKSQTMINQIIKIHSDCNENQIAFITDIIKTTKDALEKYEER